jgi:hypothetical protein
MPSSTAHGGADSPSTTVKVPISTYSQQSQSCNILPLTPRKLLTINIILQLICAATYWLITITLSWIFIVITILSVLYSVFALIGLHIKRDRLYIMIINIFGIVIILTSVFSMALLYQFSNCNSLLGFSVNCTTSNKTYTRAGESVAAILFLLQLLFEWGICTFQGSIIAENNLYSELPSISDDDDSWTDVVVVKSNQPAGPVSNTISPLLMSNNTNSSPARENRNIVGGSNYNYSSSLSPGSLRREMYAQKLNRGRL